MNKGKTIPLPPLWAEKHLAPILAEAQAVRNVGPAPTVIATVAREDFDAAKPGSVNTCGLIVLTVGIVSPKTIEKMRKQMEKEGAANG